MELIGCPEMSVGNYPSTLRKIPEEHRSQKHKSSAADLQNVLENVWEEIVTLISVNNILKK
jgi:hypothetical protein